MLEKIKKHWKVAVLALVVGLVVGMPIVLSVGKIGLDNFKGVYPTFHDDEEHYIAMTREAYDGNLGLGSTYIKEYKANPYVQPPLAEIIIAFISKVLGISVALMVVINNFVLPAISVFLLYFFFLKITDSKKISLISTGIFFLLFIFTFGRPINPQFSFIFLLIGLNLVLRIIPEKDTKSLLIYNLLLAIDFGLLIYIYPFYWMTIFVFYSGLILVNALKDKEYKFWLRNIIFFVIPVGIISIPFGLNFLKLSASSLYLETSLRSGFLNTHMPGAFFNVALLIFCIPIMFLLQKRHGNQNLILGWVLVLGGILLNWQNVITGKNFQFAPHFYQLSVLFLIIVGALFFYSVKSFSDIKKDWKTAVPIIIFIVASILILYRQKHEIYLAAKNIYNPYDISSIQNISEAMSWLQKNTPKDSVVYVLGNRYAWGIPIYTHNNLYFAPDAALSLMPDSELEKRWAIQKFFEDIGVKDIDNNRDIWSNKFIESYYTKEVRRKILELITGKKYYKNVLIDPIYINRVLEEHKNYRKEGFERAVKTFDVDYVLIDKTDKRYKDALMKMKNFSFLKKAAEYDSVVIYEIK